MSQNKEFNLNYYESVFFLNSLKDLSAILNNIACNHPTLIKDSSLITMRTFAYMIPFCDTENLLKVYNTLGKVLIHRNNYNDLPKISNERIVEYIRTICSFNESIVTLWNNNLTDCPEDLSLSIINLLNVVKDKNSNK